MARSGVSGHLNSARKWINSPNTPPAAVPRSPSNRPPAGSSLTRHLSTALYRAGRPRRYSSMLATSIRSRDGCSPVPSSSQRNFGQFFAGWRARLNGSPCAQEKNGLARRELSRHFIDWYRHGSVSPLRRFDETSGRVGNQQGHVRRGPRTAEPASCAPSPPNRATVRFLHQIAELVASESSRICRGFKATRRGRASMSTVVKHVDCSFEEGLCARVQRVTIGKDGGG